MFGIYLALGIAVFLVVWIYGERYLIRRQQRRHQATH